jgi:hypothetical protein
MTAPAALTRAKCRLGAARRHLGSGGGGPSQTERAMPIKSAPARREVYSIGQLPRVGGGNIGDERTAADRRIRSALTRI